MPGTPPKYNLPVSSFKNYKRPKAKDSILKKQFGEEYNVNPSARVYPYSYTPKLNKYGFLQKIKIPEPNLPSLLVAGIGAEFPRKGINANIAGSSFLTNNPNLKGVGVGGTVSKKFGKLDAGLEISKRPQIHLKYNFEKGGPLNSKNNTQPPYNTSGPRTSNKESQEEKDAMNAMMKAKLAYAYIHGNPAAKRMVAPTDNPYVFPKGHPEYGNTGTHYISSYDNYAIPEIQDVDGTLEFTGPRANEEIEFDRPEDARYFAKNYKRVSPAFQKQGGKLNLKEAFEIHNQGGGAGRISLEEFARLVPKSDWGMTYFEMAEKYGWEQSDKLKKAEAEGKIKSLKNGGSMAPIIPTYYKSKGTPIYRDTTDAPPTKYNKGGFLENIKNSIQFTKKFIDGGKLGESQNTAYNILKNNTQPVDKFGNVNVNYQGPTTFRSLSNQVNAPIPTKADELTNQYGYDYKKTYDESGTPHYYTKKEGADSWIDLETEGNKNSLAAVKALTWGDDTSYIGTEAHKNQIRDQLIKNEDARIKGLSSEEYTKELFNRGISYEDLNKASFEEANKEKTNTQYASVYDAITGNNKNTITTTEDNIARDKYGNPRKAVFGEPGYREQQTNLNTGNAIKPVTKYKESYHKTNAITSELLEKIAKSTMSNIEKRNLLQNPEKLQNLLINYEGWKSSPQGRKNDAYSRRGAVKSDDFTINADGTANYQQGANPVVIDGGVDMLDKEWITGVAGGKAFSELLGGTAGMIASKFKGNPTMQATGKALTQPLLTNTAPQFSKYMLSPLKLADVAGGLYGVDQFRDPTSMTRQSIKNYQQGKGSFEDAFNVAMSGLSVLPVGSEILRSGYGTALGGINALRKVPQIRDFVPGVKQVAKGEAKFKDLFTTDKYSRVFDSNKPGSKTNRYWYQRTDNPELSNYVAQSDKFTDLIMTPARASEWNVGNIQRQVQKGLTTNPLDIKAANRSVASMNDPRMISFIENNPALKNPKTRKIFEQSLKNPNDYWKLPGYTDEIAELIAKSPASKFELNLPKTAFKNIKTRDIEDWSPDYNLLDDFANSYGGAKAKALRATKKGFDYLGKYSSKLSKINKAEQAGFDLSGIEERMRNDELKSE